MDICLYTDSVADLTLDEALDFAAESGISAVEIASGGLSSAPHMRVRELLGSAPARAAFADKLSSRGLRLAAVNCAAWPLHPRYGDEHVEMIRTAIRIAGELGVDTIVTMSGCPGDGPQARTLNWIGLPWTVEARGILDEQWDVAIDAWRDIAAFAVGHGVTRIALELLPLHLAYNVPTLLRLRDAVGPVIGANVDPSHFFWQQIDPLASVRELGPAVHHVHLKDLVVNEQELGLYGVLDARPFDDPERRAWLFRTVGAGHPPTFWNDFIGALREVGYDDAVSIENEDPLLPGTAGVRQALLVTRTAMAANGLAPAVTSGR